MSTLILSKGTWEQQIALRSQAQSGDGSFRLRRSKIALTTGAITKAQKSTIGVRKTSQLPVRSAECYRRSHSRAFSGSTEIHAVRLEFNTQPQPGAPEAGIAGGGRGARKMNAPDTYLLRARVLTLLE